MSDWNHPICDDCWDERNPDRLAVRRRQRSIEHCCYCGRHTESGILLRADPATIDRHEDHKRGVVDR